MSKGEYNIVIVLVVVLGMYDVRVIYLSCLCTLLSEPARRKSEATVCIASVP